jgi:DNA-binding NarL/FixJ family response regulator
MRKRVVIADDHSIWRSGLREVLEPTFEVVGEASEGSEAVDRAMEHRPDVVIMDISMPTMDGIEAARQIKQKLPQTGIVILSVTDSDDKIYEAIRSGVDSYVVKDDAPESIVHAVENAAEGRGYLPPRIARKVMESVSQGFGRDLPVGANPRANLTERERNILRLIAEGYTNKAIGRELSISERTVGNHITNIYNKLGINDRAHATAYAIKNNLI